jgi:hypothetical protein
MKLLNGWELKHYRWYGDKARSEYVAKGNCDDNGSSFGI